MFPPHLACCPNSTAKAWPPSFQPWAQAAQAPRSTGQGRSDTGGSFPTPQPHGALTPAAMVQLVIKQDPWAVWALSVTKNLRLPSLCCLSPWHGGDLHRACQGSGTVTAFITEISLTRVLFLIYSKEKRPKARAGPSATCAGTQGSPKLSSTYSFLPFFSLLRCHVLYFRRRLQYSSELGSSSSSFLGGPRWILKSLGVNAEDVRLQEEGQRDKHGTEQRT